MLFWVDRQLLFVGSSTKPVDKFFTPRSSRSVNICSCFMLRNPFSGTMDAGSSLTVGEVTFVLPKLGAGFTNPFKGGDWFESLGLLVFLGEIAALDPKLVTLRMTSLLLECSILITSLVVFGMSTLTWCLIALEQGEGMSLFVNLLLGESCLKLLTALFAILSSSLPTSGDLKWFDYDSKKKTICQIWTAT